METNFIKRFVLFTLLLYVYFVISQLIANEDELIVLLHFFIYSIFSYLLIITFKYIKSNLLKYSVLKLYLGYIVFLPFFHENKLYYEDKSLRSVGYFDFSLYHYLELFSVVLYFLVLLILCTYLIEKILFRKISLKKLNQDHKEQHRSRSLEPLLLIGIFLIFTQLAINIFMFNNKLGIAGINPNDLGFKLTGLLYYYKKFFFPLIILYITFKYINNKYIVILITLMFFELLQGSVYSASKGVVILHGAPIGYYLLKRKKLISLSLFTLFIFFLIGFVPIGRNLLYKLELSSFHGISLFSLLKFNFEQLFVFKQIGIIDLVVEGLRLFLLRMVALKEFAMVYFNVYQPMDPNIFINTYLKLPFTQAPNWNEYAFFGFDTSFIEKKNSEGFTFAYSLGIFSKVYLAERFNVLYLFIIYIVSALIFERLLIKTLNIVKVSNIFKIIAFYFVVLLFIQFFYIINLIFYAAVVYEIISSTLKFLATYKKPILFKESKT